MSVLLAATLSCSDGGYRGKGEQPVMTVQARRSRGASVAPPPIGRGASPSGLSRPPKAVAYFLPSRKLSIATTEVRQTRSPGVAPTLRPAPLGSAPDTFTCHRFSRAIARPLICWFGGHGARPHPSSRTCLAACCTQATARTPTRLASGTCAPVFVAYTWAGPRGT